MRALAIVLVLAAGCTDPPRDGALACGSNVAHPCPAGYSCVAGRCYVAGHQVDDMSVAIAPDDMTVSVDLAQQLDMAVIHDLATVTAIDDDFVGGVLDSSVWSTSGVVSVVGDSASGAVTATKADSSGGGLNLFESHALGLIGDFTAGARLRITGIGNSSSVSFGIRGSFSTAFLIPSGAPGGWQVLIGGSVVAPNGTPVALGTGYADFEIKRSGTAVTMSIGGTVLHTTTAGALAGDTLRVSISGGGAIFADRVTFVDGP